MVHQNAAKIFEPAALSEKPTSATNHKVATDLSIHACRPLRQGLNSELSRTELDSLTRPERAIIARESLSEYAWVDQEFPLRACAR
jgi:hypothetical protein